MNFEVIQNDHIITSIKGKKDVIFAVATFIVFFAVAAYYLFSINVSEQDITNYGNISQNPYEKYERMMTASGIKTLVENEQFQTYKYNSNLDSFIQQSTPSANGRDNMFLKNF